MTPCTATGWPRSASPRCAPTSERAASSSRSSDATGTFDAESREIQAAARPPGRPGTAPRPPPGGARAPRDARPAHRARQPQAARGATRRRHRRGRPATGGRSPWCSWTSTASRRSTTASAIGSATTCSSRSPRDSGRWRARATRWPDTAATSSSSCARTPRRTPPRPLAERFRQAVRRPLESVPPRYAVAASIGVAVWEPAQEPDGARRPAAAHSPTRPCTRRRAPAGIASPLVADRHGDATDPTQHSTTTRPEAAWEH